MTPDQAAATLHALLEDRPWFRRVVVGTAFGAPVLYLFVVEEADCTRPGLPPVWESYPVLVRLERIDRGVNLSLE